MIVRDVVAASAMLAIPAVASTVLLSAICGLDRLPAVGQVAARPVMVHTRLAGTP
jgi:hypothetical protein